MTSPPAARDELLAALLAELTEQARAGQPVDIDAVAARNADLAEELRQLWATVQFAQQFSRPQLAGEPPPTIPYQLVNAPATVSVVSADVIQSTPSTNYAELFRSVPGVNISQTSARDFNITMRGATSTLATSQLAILDGRTLYQDFFGFVMWDFMPSNLNEIKQIEVIRGPASAVWGANALSGVINVITKTPREMEGTSFMMGAGSFGREYKPEPGSPAIATQPQRAGGRQRKGAKHNHQRVASQANQRI